jgi:acyl-CoA oxidase
MTKVFGKHGLNHFAISQKNGGHGVDPMKYAALALEMSRVDASIATMWLVHTALFGHTMDKFASDELNKEYKPKILSGEYTGAWGLTEPEFGSDASGLGTTAAQQPDGSWALNGMKRWPGNANKELMTVFARNTTTKQINCFLVHLDWPGITRTKIENKMSLRSIHNMNIDFKNVRVEAKYRLTKVNKFSDVNEALLYSRIMVGWLACGVGLSVYDNLIKYVSGRTQFGKTLTSYQLIQDKIVRVMGNVQAALLMTWNATRLLKEGNATIGKVGLAKAYATKLVREAAALGREAAGGNGILLDHGLMKPFLDIESLYTYEGTFDINLLVTGRELTGTAAFKAK